MNVLMIGTQLAGGGAGRITELIARELRRQGHHVSAIVRDNLSDDLPSSPAVHWRARAIMRALHDRGFPELGNLASFLWRYHAEYAQADVIHLNNLHGEYLSIAALPWWGRDKPLVWTLHDAWAVTGNCAYPRRSHNGRTAVAECGRWRHGCGRCPQLGQYPMSGIDRSRFYRWLKPRLTAWARPVLVPSSHWLAGLVRQVPQLARLPLRVIGNPVDVRVFAPPVDRADLRRSFGLEPGAATVVIVGCLYGDPRKNAPDALRALRAAARAVPGMQLLAVGASGERLLSESGVRGRALPFLADREMLASAYGCGDVCLFPSLADNLPLTVLESMATATPVVAYAAGGVPEQVAHGRTGYLAAEGDRDQLTRGLVELLRNPALTRRMGVAARALVARTAATEVIAEQFGALYEQAIRLWCRRRGRKTPRRQPGSVGRFVAAALGWNQAPVRDAPAPPVALERKARVHERPRTAVEVGA